MRSESPDPPALVLGASYTALGVVRSLGTCGVRVLIAGPSADVASRSRFVRGAVEQVETGEPGPVLEAARDLGLERAVLFPCSDLWCEAVYSLPADTRKQLLVSMPSRETTAVLLDKARLADLLGRHGIPCPQTVPVERKADLATMRTGARAWILKPRSSQRFARVFGRKAFLEHDLREAEEHLEACLGVGLPMVLQEFVPGPATGHVFVDGFVDRSGIVRARLARRRLRPYPHELGNSSSGISIAPAEVAESVAALEKLLVSLPYRGIFSAEFKQDEESGVYKLLEINCRPFWYVDFARRCGVNLCLMAYRDALGAPVRTVDEYRVGLPFGFAMVEVRALLDQSRRGTVTRGALASGLLRMTKLPFRFDDPGPALVRLTQVTRGRVLRV